MNCPYCKFEMHELEIKEKKGELHEARCLECKRKFAYKIYRKVDIYKLDED